MKTKKCKAILIPLDITKMQPKDCIGMLFLNKNNVLSILNNLEDIIKSHNYFDAIPQQWVLVEPHNKDKILVTESNIPKNYIQQFIEEYRNGKISNIEIEMEEIYQPYFENNTFHKNPTKFTPKLTNGFVTIIDNKSILYTEEEVWNFVYNSSEIILNWIVENLQGKKVPQPNILEWFNKNKKTINENKKN